MHYAAPVCSQMWLCLSQMRNAFSYTFPCWGRNWWVHLQLQTGCSIPTHGRACSIHTHYLCTFEHACTYICTCCSNTYFNSCEAELYCLAFNQECTLAKTKAMGHYQMQLGSLQLLILCPRDTCIYDTVEAHCCIIRECRGFFKQFHAAYSTHHTTIQNVSTWSLFQLNIWVVQVKETVQLMKTPGWWCFCCQPEQILHCKCIGV